MAPKTRRLGSALKAAERSRTEGNHHLRHLDSEPFVERTMPVQFRRELDANWLPLLNLTGYCRRKQIERQQETARQCLYNLVLAGLPNGVVSDTRNTSQAHVRMRIGVWDAIESAKLLIKCRGSEESAKVTRYQATPRLLKRFRDWPASHLVNVNLTKATDAVEPSWDAMILVKDEQDKTKLVPITPDQLAAMVSQDVSVLDCLTMHEDQITAINENNLAHDWKTYRKVRRVDGTFIKTTFKPNIVIQQIHSGRLFRYTRNYTRTQLSAQSLSKQERRWMTIDGEPSAELDYAGFHTRMMYHLKGIDPKAKDIYQPHKIMPRFYSNEDESLAHRKIIRDLVKISTNICWNTRSRRQAVEAIKGVIRDHSESAFLKQALAREHHLTPSGIVQRLMKLHHRLNEWFFVQRGADLMTLDAYLMLGILESFAQSKKPALDLHDGIVCKAQDAEFAESFMRICYHQMFSFFPVIRREF